MTNSLAFNPIITTNAQGSFNAQSVGHNQGVALDDPAVRNQLAGGVLNPAETLPMWGGVGITEIVPGLSTQPSGVLGGYLARAVSLTAPTTGAYAAGPLTGFSVFNQDHSMVNSPQSPVPLASAYMGVNFYRLGSLARIAVAIDPALVNLEGTLITSLVSWDFSQQRLIPYVAAYAAQVLTAQSWAAGILTYTTTGAHGIGVGTDFTILGSTPSGYNGTYTATAGTAGSTIKAELAADPGASTVLGSLLAGGGALPVKVLDVQIGNSMTISYDTVTGFATWNRSGSTAIIQI